MYVVVVGIRRDEVTPKGAAYVLERSHGFGSISVHSIKPTITAIGENFFLSGSSSNFQLSQNSICLHVESALKESQP
jgi:hypothetical protein